jgi:ATP/maltotriose-dependent transcriptional regulator MalT
MVFRLEHLPPHVHMVISSRADPLLALVRLRDRGELVEVRAADLRFTPDEVATYLNDDIGLDLTPDDIAALGGRTEGWIAALQLHATERRAAHAKVKGPRRWRDQEIRPDRGGRHLTPVDYNE